MRLRGRREAHWVARMWGRGLSRGVGTVWVDVGVYAVGGGCLRRGVSDGKKRKRGRGGRTYLKNMSHTLYDITGTLTSARHPFENFKSPRAFDVVPSGKTTSGAPGMLVRAWAIVGYVMPPESRVRNVAGVWAVNESRVNRRTGL